MKFALKIIVAAGLLGAIAWKLGGINEVGEQIFRIRPLYALFAVALISIDRGLMTYKWGLLLRARGIRLPFFRGLMIYCASWVWGLFLPTTVGSDAIRAYCTSRDGIDSGEVVSSIIIERFLGFLSAILLAILSLVLLTRIGHLGDRVGLAWVLAGGLLLGACILFAVSVNDGVFSLVHDRILDKYRNFRFVRKLREFHETYRSSVVDRKTLGVFLGLTFCEQLFPITTSWLIARGLGIEVGPLYFAVALPLAMLVSRLPLSFDGIGVFEGIFILLMTWAGLTAAQAFAIAIVGRILTVMTVVPWWMAMVVTTGNIHAPDPLRGESRRPVPQDGAKEGIP